MHSLAAYHRVPPDPSLQDSDTLCKVVTPRVCGLLCPKMEAVNKASMLVYPQPEPRLALNNAELTLMASHILDHYS